MSKIEKMLQGVEVEWKALGEVCDFKNGFAFKSSLFKSEGFPIIRITNIDGKNINMSDVKFFDPSDYRESTNSYIVNFGDILIAMSGATTGKIGYYNLNTPAFINQRVGKFIPKEKILNNRYLYHYLLSKVNYIYAIAGGGAQPNLSSNVLMDKLYIPIPPLEVQKEIVRILDSFTTLTAELQAELQARKLQYEYYRDELLSVGDEVEWKTLGEVGKVLRGRRLTRQELSIDGKYAVYHGGIIPLGYYSEYNRDADTVMIINVGASAGTVGYSDTKFWSSDGCYCLDNNNRINNRFLYYYLLGEEHFLKSKVRYAGIPTLDAIIIEKIKIPIPPLSEQERIVNILDKFDTLTNSITEGLPREIALRQQQYEYYREMLFSFPSSEL